MNSACVPLHVRIQSIAADVGEAPALGSGDRLQRSSGAAGDSHPHLRRRAFPCLPADEWAATKAPAYLARGEHA